VKRADPVYDPNKTVFACAGKTEPRVWSVGVLDELSTLARELGQIDAKDSLLLASLVAASHEFIGIADLDGNALFVNKAGRELIGLRDLKAVRSTQIIDYFAPEDRHTIQKKVLPAVRDTGFWEGELKFQNFETGRFIPVLYNIFPVQNSTRRAVRKCRSRRARVSAPAREVPAFPYTLRFLACEEELSAAAPWRGGQWVITIFFFFSVTDTRISPDCPHKQGRDFCVT
jgi:PAS domain S-box-containing protein